MIGKLYAIEGKKVLISKEKINHSCIGCMFRDEEDTECLMIHKDDLPCGYYKAIFTPYNPIKGIKKKLTLQLKLTLNGRE